LFSTRQQRFPVRFSRENQSKVPRIDALLRRQGFFRDVSHKLMTVQIQNYGMAGFSPNFAAESTSVEFFSLLDVGDGKCQMKEDWVHIPILD
jgi:hypothetical protein